MQKVYKYRENLEKKCKKYLSRKAQRKGLKELKAYVTGKETPRTRVRAAIKRAEERQICVDREFDIHLYNRFLELGEIARELAETLKFDLEVSVDSKSEMQGVLLFSGQSIYLFFEFEEAIHEKILTLLRESIGISIINNSKEFFILVYYRVGETQYRFNTEKTPGA